MRVEEKISLAKKYLKDDMTDSPLKCKNKIDYFLTWPDKHQDMKKIQK